MLTHSIVILVSIHTWVTCKCHVLLLHYKRALHPPFPMAETRRRTKNAHIQKQNKPFYFLFPDFIPYLRCVGRWNTTSVSLPPVTQKDIRMWVSFIDPIPHFIFPRKCCTSKATRVFFIRESLVCCLKVPCWLVGWASTNNTSAWVGMQRMNAILYVSNWVVFCGWKDLMTDYV